MGARIRYLSLLRYLLSKGTVPNLDVYKTNLVSIGYIVICITLMSALS